MSDHLHRDLAPFTDDAWAQVDEEAAGVLRKYLAARKLVDVRGPLGWAHACEPAGRVTVLPDVEGLTARRREVVPMIELQVGFALARSEIDDIERNRPNPDLEAVTEASRRIALAEDRLAFSGLAAAGVEGIASASPHDPVEIDEDFAAYPAKVASALATLRDTGVAGPYALALGPRCYTGVTKATENGAYPLLEHLGLMLGGPVLWAPALDGAVVVSQRGGDAELVIGQDVSIGYRSHDASAVELFLEESITVVVHDAAAAVPLNFA